MDALLSLPVVGYFVMPSLGTYSASLNLLFFYMTWSTLVLSQPPLRVEIIGTLAVRLLFFLVPSLLFLLFDTLVPTLAVEIKTQGPSALPTRTAGISGVKRARTRPEWYHVVALSFFNVCAAVAVQAGVEMLFTDVLGIRSALKVTTTLPMPWSIAKDIARGFVLREVCCCCCCSSGLLSSSSSVALKLELNFVSQILQYYIHRFVLHPSSPNYISDLHNKYFHSLSAPYSFSTHYDHPLPYLLWRFIPSYLPSALFRTHLLTHLLFLSLTTLEETLTLSGYSVLPGIMLGGLARRQDTHSRTRGRGNFAPWGFLDWLHGTGIGADVVEDLKDEADKHQVKKRGQRAWGDAKVAQREGLRSWSGRRKGRKS
jgi:hypothetical protein